MRAWGCVLHWSGAGVPSYPACDCRVPYISFRLPTGIPDIPTDTGTPTHRLPDKPTHHRPTTGDRQTDGNRQKQTPVALPCRSNAHTLTRRRCDTAGPGHSRATHTSTSTARAPHRREDSRLLVQRSAVQQRCAASPGYLWLDIDKMPSGAFLSVCACMGADCGGGMRWCCGRWG